MESAVAYRRAILLALCLLGLMWALKLVVDSNVDKFLAAVVWPGSDGKGRHAPAATTREGVVIKDKVAVITDTRYTERLVPLILHFSAVLGPSWPIVLFTTAELASQQRLGRLWQQATADGRVEARVVPDEFELTTRHGVNVYLSRPWLWEQLAPAKQVLVFQTDAIVCANSGRLVADFADWDWIGAHFRDRLYNGGLSLRNRTALLALLAAGHDWETDVAAGRWDGDRGEDVYFTHWLSAAASDPPARLPDRATALQFSCEFAADVQQEKRPFGYHNIIKHAPDSMPEISEWCPEIHLAAVGDLPR